MRVTNMSLYSEKIYSRGLYESVLTIQTKRVIKITLLIYLSLILFSSKWAKCEMEDTINSEMSGDLCEGLQILLKCVRNKNQFLADKLQEALRDKDTKTATRRILGEVHGARELSHLLVFPPYN